MSVIYLGALTALCIAMLGQGLLVSGRFYQFPFFAAGIFLTFVLPQLPGLIASYFIPDDALNKTLLFSTACLAMCWIGWATGVRAQEMRDFCYSERRLLTAATALSVFGAYFFYKFGQLPDEERLRGMHTGTAVMYLFFAKLLTYGFAIALICYARHPSRAALVIIAFDTLFYLQRILIAGKRGETAEFLLLIALALWFQKRWAAPRLVIAFALAFSVVGMLGAEEYRQATLYNGDPNWSRVMNIDLAASWERLQREGGPEMTNAVMVIQNVDRNMTFSYGFDLWNWIVFTYIPAQIVGSSFKSSLTIALPPIFERGYDATIGSTSTGMADAFASFWYLGCLKFGLIAWLLGRIYAAAMRGNTAMQLLYMLSAVPSILAITHFTDEIIMAWIHIAVFGLPVLYYARVGSIRNHRATAASQMPGAMIRPGLEAHG